MWPCIFWLLLIVGWIRYSTCLPIQVITMKECLLYNFFETSIYQTIEKLLETTYLNLRVYSILQQTTLLMCCSVSSLWNHRFIADFRFSHFCLYAALNFMIAIVKMTFVGRRAGDWLPYPKALTFLESSSQNIIAVIFLVFFNPLPGSLARFRVEGIVSGWIQSQFSCLINVWYVI